MTSDRVHKKSQPESPHLSEAGDPKGHGPLLNKFGNRRNCSMGLNRIYYFKPSP